MSYEPGTRLDLRHINRKQSVGGDLSMSKSARETASHYYQVGTEFVFRLVDGEYHAALRIPIMLG